MPVWWNGIHSCLKSNRPKGIESSNLSAGTIKIDSPCNEMPLWRNARRGRLKIDCLKGRAGWIPVGGTKLQGVYMRPHNKHERRIIGKNKGFKRATGLQEGWDWLNSDKKEWMKKASRILQNTTKLCSCQMCRNPRRSNWSEKLTMQELKDLEFVHSEFENVHEMDKAA